MEKRERASRKIRDDLALCIQRKRDIDELNAVMDKMKEVKAMMDKKIPEYQIFDKFLEDVVDQTDFLVNTDVINRYLSLMNTKNYMAQIQEANLRDLENARNDMVRSHEKL